MPSLAHVEATGAVKPRIAPYSAWPKGAEVPEEWIAAAYAKRKAMRLPRINCRIEAEAFANHFSEHPDRYFADWQRRFVTWCVKSIGTREEEPTDAATGETVREIQALARVKLAMRGIPTIGLCREDVVIAYQKGVITLEQAKGWRRWSSKPPRPAASPA